MKYDHKDLRNQYWFLAGVVSYGPSECGTDNFPGVYTRVNYTGNYTIICF